MGAERLSAGRVTGTIALLAVWVKIPGVNPDYSDVEPYQVELEKLGWDLVELGASRQCDSIEAANEAIIAKHQKKQLKR